MAYNTRTINDLNTNARNTMLQEIENLNWCVIGFSETKKKENKIELLGVEHKVFFYSNDIVRSNGVGFLVNKRFASLTLSDPGVSSSRYAVTKKWHNFRTTNDYKLTSSDFS